MPSHAGLFSGAWAPRNGATLPEDLSVLAPLPERTTSSYAPRVDERLLDIYARADDPSNPYQLRDLWLGRVECEIGTGEIREDLARLWLRSRVRRTVDGDAVLSARVTARFVKELFNAFF